MERSWLQDMIAVVVIAAVGLLPAFVTFGILQSQGTATDYSREGCLVGALVSTSLLSSI
jgi:hypothetical protein